MIAIKRRREFLLLIIILASLFFPLSSSEAETKYLIIKTDDVGGGLEYWDWFYEFCLTHEYHHDLGIIGNLISAEETTELNYLLQLKNKDYIGYYNHGWDHNIPEFEAQTLEYMIDHIKLWDDHIYNLLNYETNILGAPGNRIGDRTAETELVYQAMAHTGYKGLFFSSVNGHTNDGKANLELTYAAFEKNIKPLSIDDIKVYFDAVSDKKYVFVQVHPHKWNVTYYSTVLETIFAYTGRVGMNIKTYYVIFQPVSNTFLPSLLFFSSLLLFIAIVCRIKTTKR
jgi:hypothetical protein